LEKNNKRSSKLEELGCRTLPTPHQYRIRKLGGWRWIALINKMRIIGLDRIGRERST